MDDLHRYRDLTPITQWSERGTRNGAYPSGRRFRAAIFKDQRSKHIGYFETAREAELASQSERARDSD